MCQLIFMFIPKQTVCLFQAVYAGKDGVFTSVQGGTLLVDCSTIDPMVAKSMSDLAKEKSATFCDAPVSGGVNAAAVSGRNMPSFELKYTLNKIYSSIRI